MTFDPCLSAPKYCNMSGKGGSLVKGGEKTEKRKKVNTRGLRELNNMSVETYFGEEGASGSSGVNGNFN